MKLTKTERLILINQYEIMKHLNIKPNAGDENDYDYLISVLKIGDEDEYQNLFFNEIPDPISKKDKEFVYQVLELYRRFAHYHSSNPNDELFQSEHYNLFFDGFDINNEEQFYSFSKYILSQKGNFDEIEFSKSSKKTNKYKSQVAMKDIYSRMLDKWKDLGEPVLLEREHIIAIKAASVHPMNRK